jgi:hypothetical protein
MARRGGTRSIQCAEDGCTEYAHYSYTSNADYGRLMQEQRRRPFMCSRHRNPEQVLTPTNRERTVTLTAARSKRYPNLGDQLFWLEPGHDDVGSGYMFGPGFSAHANDFPEGTRIVIRVTVEEDSEVA